MQRSAIIGFVVGVAVATATTGVAARALISGNDIRDGSITAKDLSPSLRKAVAAETPGSGSVGPVGPQGPAGPQGPVGPQGERGAPASGPSVVGFVHLHGNDEPTGYGFASVESPEIGPQNYITRITFDRSVQGCAITTGLNDNGYRSAAVPVYTRADGLGNAFLPEWVPSWNQVVLTGLRPSIWVVVTCP